MDIHGFDDGFACRGTSDSPVWAAKGRPYKLVQKQESGEVKHTSPPCCDLNYIFLLAVLLLVFGAAPSTVI